jgi:hypothetical protein
MKHDEEYEVPFAESSGAFGADDNSISKTSILSPKKTDFRE